ncbi:MAG: putative metal-dependent phosphoesterase, PHP family [Candidatus Peregrinibacteria bacterium GW2011_GWA2_38_36]|nr:MAG: putative metal-dependent phosphoesterase, PHP family [Candidatus Peregrinibacteria bacterium GW2011_GWA2_38_36]
MPLKAQLHVHSKSDKRDYISSSEKQIIDKAHSLGYEVLAFTCHDSVIFSDELKKYAEEKGILLIPGIEKEIEKCHVVILNANKKAENIHTFKDLKKYKKNHPKSLICAPHMYYPRHFFIKTFPKIIKHLELFDAIEYSYFYTKFYNPYNEKAQLIAKKYNIPMIGTSDNHIIKYFDKTYSLINAKKNWESIANAIKKGHIEIETKPMKSIEIIHALLYMIFITTGGNLLRNLLRIVKI